MTGALSLLAGVLTGLGAARAPHVAWFWITGIALVVSLWSPLREAALVRRLALFLAGIALACGASVQWQSSVLMPATPDARVLLEGTIVTVPARDGVELHFDADVRVREGPGADGRSRRARLSWREPPVAPRVGERWRLLARLGRADETRNFSGFDAARAAFRDRIHLAAGVLPSALNTRLALAEDSVDVRRARIATRIAAAVADPDAAALITALAVGLTDGMSRDQWRVFNATGTTHLVAISGLHVTLFAVLAFGCARISWRWLPGGCGLDREPFAVLSGLIAAGGYSLLAGLSVPTQRTWLMLAVFAAARLAARNVGAARTWSLALIAVLLVDVVAPLAAGFWLSFVAVGVILMIESGGLVPGTHVARVLRLQFAVMLVLAPLTFAVFGGVSLVGLFVNLVAIPVISFVFVPLVLAGALAAGWWPTLDGMPFAAAAALYEWLWPALVWAADLELSAWRFQPPAWWFVLAVPAVLLLVRRWPAGLRLSAASLVLPLLFAPSRLPERGELRVSVLDAGRGASVLVTTHAQAFLFDTGDSWNSRGTRVARIVVPALESFGVTRIHGLVLPSLDADRAAGAALLVQDRHVERILVGGGWPATSLPVSACTDARIDLQELRLETFAAGRDGRYCVLRISVGRRSLLLAGDLDISAERELLFRLPPGSLASEVVILSRQAGGQGSSPEWIEACDAGLVIATGGIAASGARMRSLERWRASGARVLDTREVGGIEFGFGTRGVAALRVSAARYPFAWRRVE